MCTLLKDLKVMLLFLQLIYCIASALQQDVVFNRHFGLKQYLAVMVCAFSV